MGSSMHAEIHIVGKLVLSNVVVEASSRVDREEEVSSFLDPILVNGKPLCPSQREDCRGHVIVDKGNGVAPDSSLSKAKCRSKNASLQPNSSKSGPPALGSSVQSSPPDQLPADLDPCKVNDPLIPSGPPCLSDPLRENCSESTLVASKLKEETVCFFSVTGLKSSGTPAILSQAMSGEGLQLGSECTPDSDPLDVTVVSPMSDSENSVYSVDAESTPEVGIPRIASCPAMLQLCNQQISQLPVPSVGCNFPNPCLPIGHSYAEILCRGLDADSQGLLESLCPNWNLPFPYCPPVSEQACGPVSYPPGPHDHAIDLVNTPPSISRILMKYSLDTSYQLGHDSSSPNGLSADSSTDSHLDTPEVSYLGSQVAPSQQDSWQPVKSRRNRRSASKDAKLLCSGAVPADQYRCQSEWQLNWQLMCILHRLSYASLQLLMDSVPGVVGHFASPVSLLILEIGCKGGSGSWAFKVAIAPIVM
ncbi:hypothetical protein Nepgr_001051 [Nepenthes gracilis]|uniref:Uncharacterized protein n=1 Tax=Nepenthes gracilis TaxID=150966 RepID=A0AAD3P7W2_NEPGR|nr:hypothetical protein Nepgr_001051 [Nepenthes gracilis]